MNSSDIEKYRETILQLEAALAEKHKEIDYYKKRAQEAGQRRLLEINQMSRLIEAKKMADKDRENVIRSLKSALDEVKILKGLIPICASCKKIRDDKGYWNQIESYIEKHSDAAFSHGLCPDCIDEMYGEKPWYIKMKKRTNPENP